jgi:hypothetical protein
MLLRKAVSVMEKTEEVSLDFVSNGNLSSKIEKVR